MHPNERRKLSIALVAGASMLLIGLVGWWLYTTRPRAVTIKYPTNVKALAVEIYRANTDEHNDPVAAQGSAVANASGPSIVQLKPGKYLVVSKATEDYQKTTTALVVGAGGGEVTIDPELSEGANAKLLAAQKANIEGALGTRFPGLGTGYQIISQALYLRGSWASATLQFNGLQDYFHVVLKKAATWQVVTKPMIVISSPLYPEIPENIVSIINREQFSGAASERE